MLKTAGLSYVYLLVAIVTEVAATSALKASEGFSRPGPSLVVILGYGCSFYCLSLVLRVIPVGVAYAIWSGLGIVLVTLVAAIAFRQVPDRAAIAGMALILAGVLVVNLLSDVVPRS